MNIEKPLPVTRSGRPVCKYGPKKKTKKFKNIECDYKERYTVIQHYDDFGMSSTLDSFYAHLGPGARESQRKKIYQWLSNRDHIALMASSPTTAKYKCWRKRGTGTTLSPESEELLVRWVCRMRCDGVPVTKNMLRIMALEAAIDECYSEDEFRASWS